MIMPTWFCSREWFYHVGKFDEGGKVSDNLIQSHLDPFFVFWSLEVLFLLV